VLLVNAFEGFFSNQLIGYDKDQVDRFIQKLTKEYDVLRRQYDDILCSQEREIAREITQD